MSVVALWSPSDHLLSVLAPIGLAMSRNPTLVVDLDPTGPRYRSDYTLADLVADGPTKTQLEPTRRGVSVLPNGGVGVEAASEVVGELAQRWPNMVIRCDPRYDPPESAIAILPLLPEPFRCSRHGPTVYQHLGLSVQPPRGALVLPPPGAATLHALTGLSSLPARSKWLRALSKLWVLV